MSTSEILKSDLVAKPGEIYILGFDVRQPGLAMRAVVQWVLDGRLPFDWNDAAKVSREIVAISEEACKGK